MPQRPSDENRTTAQQSHDQPSQHRKGRKESHRFTKPPIPTNTINDKNIVNLSSKTPSTDHITLLNKGLTFCPPQICNDLRDIFLFNRRVRLTHHFNCDTPTTNPSPRDHFHPFKSSSGWTPPPGKDPFIDSFTGNLTTNTVNQPPPTRYGNSLNTGELQALKDLKLHNDIVIKPADKGGAIVLQNIKRYIEEGLRQLSNPENYEPSTVTFFTLPPTR